MSEFETTEGLDTTGTDTGRKAQAKQVLGQAGQTLKNEAQSFASAAQERARAEALKRTETATRTLTDFANAIRRAGDELSAANQSPVARLVAQAADGLEGVATNLAGKQPEELLDAVRDFGRRNPIAFIGGAVLVGVALGRFVRASDTSAQDSQGLGGMTTYPMAETGYGAGASAMGAGPLGEDALATAEEDGFDGPAEAGLSGGLAAPVADDLGDLRASDADDTTSVLGADDGTSVLGVDDGTSVDATGGTGDLTGRGR